MKKVIIFIIGLFLGGMIVDNLRVYKTNCDVRKYRSWIYHTGNDLDSRGYTCLHNEHQQIKRIYAPDEIFFALYLDFINWYNNEWANGEKE